MCRQHGLHPLAGEQCGEVWQTTGQDCPPVSAQTQPAPGQTRNFYQKPEVWGGCVHVAQVNLEIVYTNMQDVGNSIMVYTLL